MLGWPRGRLLIRHAILLSGSFLIISGCATPSLNVAPSMPPAPTVMQLQDHVTCLIVDAIKDNLGPEAKALAQNNRQKMLRYNLWHKIVEYNVLDNVNLTITVSQAQSLNPSLSFMTPLTALGHPIERIIDSSNGITTPTNVTSGSYNRSLSVGFQLSGAQIHNVLVTYTIDMHKIYDAMYAVDNDGSPIPRAKGAIQWCGDARAAGYGLSSDLPLAETLETGLQALDRAVYSPMTAGSASSAKAAQSASSASVSQSAGATGFSSKIDFTLGWGLNGGPSWTLLKIKGPTGGNTQLVNYSRSKDDTLISTFSATCHTDSYIDLADGRLFYKPVAKPQEGADTGENRSFEIDVYVRRQPDPRRRPDNPEDLPYPESDDRFYSAVADEYVFEIAIPKDSSGLRLTSSNNGTGVISLVSIPTVKGGGRVHDNMNGTISVSSFSTAGTHSFSYSVRGALADAQSGSFVGYMHAGVTVDGGGGHVNNLDVSRNALQLILGETGTGPNGFWESLPSCSTAGPFLLNNQNILQQLPKDVSATLQQ